LAQSGQPRSSARVTYDRLSRWYDLLAGSEQRLVRLGVERLAAQPGEAVLEIGPGTGHALLALARAVGRAGHVVGVDLSPGMLRQAASRLARAGLDRQVRLLCADAAHLPLPPSSFDAAFLSFTLELFDAPAISLVLGECRRVLRSFGRLCVVALASEGGSRRMLRLYGWAHARYPEWVDCRPILPERLLQDNGFRIQEVARGGMWGLPVQIVLASRAP
jgi:demethylmenaquinone methyltransferase/2-methoxy-6-polyprenyl-1,4-benzoquinol methylase